MHAGFVINSGYSEVASLLHNAATNNPFSQNWDHKFMNYIHEASSASRHMAVRFFIECVTTYIHQLYVDRKKKKPFE